jgi:hypothetical protein
MRHFFTKSTVEATIWCKRCGRETLWKVAGGRPMCCETCMSSGDFAWKQAPKPPPVKRLKPPQQLPFDFTEDP